MTTGFEDFSDLEGASASVGGGGGAEKTAPEDEFFHSIYISGKSRKNESGVEEKGGHLQIRGVTYNHKELHMIITHTKDIKLKEKDKGKQWDCFSYKDGEPPWKGTSTLSDGSNRLCPLTSSERAMDEFCNPCREQILIAGIYCKKDGSPILTEEKKPIFVFLRGKGMKYSGVSTYLSDRYNEDLDPLFTPTTEASQTFEKKVVNNKRFVLNIGKDEAESGYGNQVNIFDLQKGIQIPDETVLKILKLSKETVEEFKKKFDWSQRKRTSGYEAAGILSTEEEPGEDLDKAKESSGDQTFSFDDIEF